LGIIYATKLDAKFRISKYFSVKITQVLIFSILSVFQRINHVRFGFSNEVNEDLRIDTCAVVFDGEVEIGSG
jgi:hypothetical protein